MKNLYIRVLVGIALLCGAQNSFAQCPGAYQAGLIWDNRDYLVTTGFYNTFVTAAQASTQRFTIGTNALSIAYTGSISSANGETANHSVDPGIDVEYNAVNAAGQTASIVITFDTAVTNLRFSIHDIDARQVVAVNGKNAAAADVTTIIAKRDLAATVLTLAPVTGIGTNPSATASNTSLGNGDNDGTIDVTIAGPVKTVTISISNTGSVGGGGDDELFLSSLLCCIPNTFPSDYRVISRPFTGMPSYILTVVDNRFMLLDPATGKLKWLFTDPGHTNMNGMAYDPYKRQLYYTYSLMGTAADNLAEKTMYRYNVDNNTITNFIPDVTAIGIPTYDPGVTSGSASFYNGSLYFGVESANSARTSGRENTVWKIDFTSAGAVSRVSQAYATRSDSVFGPGDERLIHDWSDIGVTNGGMLYDFDGAGAGTTTRDSMYYHYSLLTGQRVQFTPSGAGNIGPKQLAIDWQEKVYNMGGLPTRSNNAQNIGGFIVPYNYNGTVDNANNKLVFVNPGPTFPTGSWGDCSEAFRPLCDFGDAPASYDPDTWSPAVNEQDTMIRIGGNFDREWLKTSSTLADADGADEDGIAFVPLLHAGGPASYNVNVSVYNHTGASATIRGWMDLNNNGLFDSGESSAAVTVPSTTATQTINLYWANAGNVFLSGQSTYMRIRLTNSAALGAANATGWYENGETEDYRVLVDNFPLSVNLISFTAKVITKDNVKLEWKTTDEANFKGYEVYRSTNNSTWNLIGTVNATGNNIQGTNTYTFNDVQPVKGKSFYRIKMISTDNKSRNSETRSVSIEDAIEDIVLYPNPSTDNKAFLSVNSNVSTMSKLSILDAGGRVICWQNILVFNGMNTISLPVDKAPSGVYTVRLQVNDQVFTKQLIISR